MAIRLIILVKERVFADALAIRLDTEPDVAVVAALHTNVPPRHLCTGMVDVLLLDGDLPDDAAFRLCEKMSHRRGAPHVVVLSHSADPVRIVRTIRAGAVGWVGKDESLDRLISVIRGVARNETCLPAGQTGQVPGLKPRGPDRDAARGTQMLSALTDGEREVLICLAQGTRRCDVAQRLHLSPTTVRTHLQNLMSKLGVHSALEAVTLTRPQLDGQLLGRRAVG